VEAVPIEFILSLIAVCIETRRNAQLYPVEVECISQRLKYVTYQQEVWEHQIQKEEDLMSNGNSRSVGKVYQAGLIEH
jgi:hypothetical protein